MAPAEIPKRTAFKPAEVCAIAGVPPYVLRSWEAEFPGLSGGKNAKGARVYGRSEVELVVRIKELVFGEGLTLGAARKQLARKQLEGDEDAGATRPELSHDALPGAEVRRKLTAVRQGLRAVLDMLSANNGAAASAPAPAAAAKPARRARPASAGKQARGRTTRSKTSTKRKRRTA